MKRLFDLLQGTVRMISFIAWVPLVVSVALSGNWHGFLAGTLGVICSVGFANTINNLEDRKIDQLNPRKKTLAVHSPVAAFAAVFVTLVLVAISLRNTEYNNFLLALLFYLSYGYARLFASFRVVKQLVVAICVAGTCFLPLGSTTWLTTCWSLVVGGAIFIRETRTNADDILEDTALRFKKLRLPEDWWCFSAPLLAPLIFFVVRWALMGTLCLGDFAIAIGLGISVHSCLLIRYRYGRYRIQIRGSRLAGRLGIVVALVGLMPSFTTIPLLVIVWINCASILFRSFQPRQHETSAGARLHDALLWASVPCLAAAAGGKGVEISLFVAVFFGLPIFLGVYLHEQARHARLLTLQPA